MVEVREMHYADQARLRQRRETGHIRRYDETRQGGSATNHRVQVNQPSEPGTATTRQRGTLKWFHGSFGFIIPDGGGKDIFLHETQLERSGINPSTLFEGQILEYAIQENKRGPSAQDITLPG